MLDLNRISESYPSRNFQLIKNKKSAEVSCQSLLLLLLYILWSFSPSSRCHWHWISSGLDCFRHQAPATPSIMKCLFAMDHYCHLLLELPFVFFPFSVPNIIPLSLFPVLSSSPFLYQSFFLWLCPS